MSPPKGKTGLCGCPEGTLVTGAPRHPARGCRNHVPGSRQLGVCLSFDPFHSHPGQARSAGARSDSGGCGSPAHSKQTGSESKSSPQWAKAGISTGPTLQEPPVTPEALGWGLTRPLLCQPILCFWPLALGMALHGVASSRLGVLPSTQLLLCPSTANSSPVDTCRTALPTPGGPSSCTGASRASRLPWPLLASSGLCVESAGGTHVMPPGLPTPLPSSPSPRLPHSRFHWLPNMEGAMAW